MDQFTVNAEATVLLWMTDEEYAGLKKKIGARKEPVGIYDLNINAIRAVFTGNWEERRQKIEAYKKQWEDRLGKRRTPEKVLQWYELSYSLY